MMIRLHKWRLFSKDGQLIDIILNRETSKNFEGFHWGSHGVSFDDRYFAFIASKDQAYPTYGQLLIADLHEEIVYDTCVLVSGSGLEWSPNSDMLVFSTPELTLDDNPPIYLLDIDQWQQYTIAYHQGIILGWREDD